MTGRPPTWHRPAIYDDPPGTVVYPLADGYEGVRRPGGRDFCRRRLSSAGRRRHERLEALSRLGYEVISGRSTGMVRHPRDDTLYSIASAAVREGLP